MRCTVDTPVANKGIAISCKRNSFDFFEKTDVLPISVKTTMWMTLSNLSKTKPMNTTNSIAAGRWRNCWLGRIEELAS